MAIRHAPPRVAVIATGDEVLAPGRPMVEGQLYASNLVEICAWLKLGGIPHEALIVGDRLEEIREAVRMRMGRVDAFVTSGGAWGSEKDLIFKALEKLKWQGIYHRVRISPGKPVGFGLLAGKPFFVLPGGPPSNEMAFLQLALPALIQMGGCRPRPFPTATAHLVKSLPGAKGWTEFIHARLEQRLKDLHVHPYLPASRLVSMARKQAIIRIPEEREEMAAGETVTIQVIDPEAAADYPPWLS
jgi:molybdopterin molybdotransferase